MRSSAPEAIRLLNKWIQERSHLRLILAMNSVSVSVLAGGEVVFAALEGERFMFKVGDAEFLFLASEAVFEYSSPEEANLPSLGITSAECVCCLSIGFLDLLKPSRAATRDFPDASMLICELRAETDVDIASDPPVD
jgi:hypothetical protein